ncbi:MAG TPA: VacJ family lipoprotein, partial [Luteolibacter sp.]|nr:VacJ family lipoprotein [Luteolibacter sp.]
GAGVCLISSCAVVDRSALGPRPADVHLPDQISDPIEPINRGVWAFNDGLLQGVIAPVGRGYRTVVPGEARSSVRKFGYNLGYPGRAINQLLQGRPGDAGDDSLRFVCNTTVGVLGLFDPATKWGIPKPSGDFGQTFSKWGWQGSRYVMLPVLGPSDESHAVGVAMDRLADPLSHTDEGRIILYGVNFNNQAETADDRLRMVRSDPDAYSTLKYFWTHAAKIEKPDWSLHGERHLPSLETLAVATLKLKDPEFFGRSRSGSVRLEATGKSMGFNYWLRDERSPLVYIVPGLGSHRQNMQSVAVAELLHARGFSVVTLSGLFHPEFIEKASTMTVPGYAAADRRDLLHAMTHIDRWMTAKHGKRLGARGLVGCSMGGFQTMAIAAEQYTAQQRGDDRRGELIFDRFLAINPPVNLQHGMQVLDDYQKAPSEWPASVRQQRINNTVHKVVALIEDPQSVPKGKPPFDGVESRYLIGLSFRLSLRNAIYSSQSRKDLGVLKQPLSSWNREAAYEEILRMSFADYLSKMVLPECRKLGVDQASFHRQGNLRSMASPLALSKNLQVITSRNDFLLSPADVGWLQTTLGSRLTLLEHGGHLGCLTVPKVHDRIAECLEPLKGR